MRTSIFLLAASMLMVAAPVVAADETDAQCEPGQMWIGYMSTKSVVDAYNATGRPGGLYVCEGEHWDGQDQVSNNSGGNDVSEGCAAPAVSPEGDDVAVCMTPTEPKDGQGTAPVGARASNDGLEHYVGVNLPVGYAVLYVDEQGTVGIYLRDNTPGNPLATAVSAAGITKGYPSESDCTQATYEEGAKNNDRTLCGRDNTAITINVLT